MKSISSVRHEKHINSSQGYPGGFNGPAAVLQYTRTEATWRCAISQSAADLEPGTCPTASLALLAIACGGVALTEVLPMTPEVGVCYRVPLEKQHRL
jgi:hypothetical protein